MRESHLADPFEISDRELRRGIHDLWIPRPRRTQIGRFRGLLAIDSSVYRFFGLVSQGSTPSTPHRPW
jgi:hypothetical protein